MLITSLLAIAGLRPAPLPLSSRRVVSRMAAILQVLSPMVDDMPSLGCSPAICNITIDMFNGARAAAVATSASQTLSPLILETFVLHSMGVVEAVAPAAEKWGRLTTSQTRDLRVAIGLIPALVQASVPETPSEPMVILPLSKSAS